jgi:hypothetical protein
VDGIIRCVEGPEQPVQISVVWPGVEDAPVMRSNAMLSQIGTGPSGPEEFVLTLGYIAPPVLLGTPEEQQASLAALGAVAAKTLCRISLSRARAQELVELLAGQIAVYDQQARGGAQT